MYKILRITDNPAQIVAAIELNRGAFELGFLGQVPGAQIVHRAEITYVTTGLCDIGMNVVCRTTSDEQQLGNLVEDMIAFFKQDELPFMWVVGPNARPLNIEQALEHYGLLYERDELGLVVDVEQFANYEPVEHVTVRRCVTAEEIADACYVQRMLTQGYAQHALWSSIAHIDWNAQKLLDFYVGYYQGEPVSTLMVTKYAGIIGIYALGTLPEVREKGFATALVQYVLHDAYKQGFKVATTVVPSQYASFYKRLGFLPSCVFQIYGMSWNRDQYEYGE